MRAIAIAIAIAISGCAAVESAGELTFGEGKIARIEQEVLWPTTDELSGLNGDSEPADGFPSTLADGTLAHLAGALAASGECHRTVESRDIQSNAISGVYVSLTICADDDRCAAQCDGGFLGMVLQVDVELVLADEKQLADVKDRFPPGVGTDAIVQVRLQFHELEMFQNDREGAREFVTGRFHDFSMGITDNVTPEVPLVAERHLESITHETPQRFDIDGEAEFTERLKTSILAGEPTTVTLRQRMRVPREHLYDLRLDGAGTLIEMQPELVISIIDVAAASL